MSRRLHDFCKELELDAQHSVRGCQESLETLSTKIKLRGGWVNEQNVLRSSEGR